MTEHPLRNATVVGAGAMGHGIAQLLAIAGKDVILVEVSEAILATARQNIQWSLRRLVEKGKIKKTKKKRR